MVRGAGDLHVSGNLTIDGSSPGGAGSAADVGWVGTNAIISTTGSLGIGLTGATYKLDVADSGASIPAARISNTHNGTTGAVLRLSNTRGGNAGATGDFVGGLDFYGRDDGNNITQWGKFVTKMADASDGSESGEMIFQVTTNGVTDTTPLHFKGNQVLILSGGGAISPNEQQYTDVAFFVSGSTSSRSISRGVALFGGDLHISGNLTVGGSSPGGGGGSPGGVNLQVQFNDGGAFGGDGGLTYNKSTNSLSAGKLLSSNISGSLTQLTDGTSYLIAGSGVSITSASNGAVTITSPTTSPAGADTEIQFNNGGAFGAEGAFTFNRDTGTLKTDNMSGSLTRLSDGTSYLKAGQNTTITSASNGAVIITSSDTTYSAGDGLDLIGTAFKVDLKTAGGLKINSTEVEIDNNIVATLTGSQFTGNVGITGSLGIQSVANFNGAVNLGNSVADDITAIGSWASSLIPKLDSTYDLGSPAKRWANIYTGDLHLRNDKGNWTIQEEADNLIVINNLTGKKYKMMLAPLEENE